ncbi:MAG TPA: hypothetical protein PKA64_00475 [Myxococcota bacterium]|nr:hypothetical protein [Myxococcota bacterium]
MNPGQRALLSAALRHARDAEALLPTSPDQAWHLAGFAPECARKACLTERWADRILGHAMDRQAEDLVRLAVALDARARRQGLDARLAAAPALQRWSPNDRYRTTGTTTAADARDLCDEARQILLEVTSGLWADGVLDTPEI